MIPLSYHANAQESDDDIRMRLADLLRGDLDLQDLIGDELDSDMVDSDVARIELDDAAYAG